MLKEQIAKLAKENPALQDEILGLIQKKKASTPNFDTLHRSATREIVGLLRWVTWLGEISDLMDRLISLGEINRMGRIEGVPLVSYSLQVDAIRAVVNGSQDSDYQVRITTHPKSGHHCTCLDWKHNSQDVGPCKHVLMLAVETKKRIEEKMGELDLSVAEISAGVILV